MIEERLRRTRQPLHVCFPDTEKLNDFLNKPVDKLKYYELSKCTVTYVC